MNFSKIQTLWERKIYCVVEGAAHSLKHHSSQPHLIKDRAWLSWEWSLQC